MTLDKIFLIFDYREIAESVQENDCTVYTGGFGDGR